MFGSIEVIIESKKVNYNLLLERNITIINGNSGKGKSVLVNMVRDAKDPTLRIKITCKVPCIAINDDTLDKLTTIKNSVIFIDEFDTDVTSKRLADYIKNSSNYFVIITRESLYQIPYSIKSVYTINNTGKYTQIGKTYNSLEARYKTSKGHALNKVDKIIIEDSGAGFSCLSTIYGKDKCVKAGGNSAVFKTISNLSGNCKSMIIIVDGAAFGAYMPSCYFRIKYDIELLIYAPESFEYLLLSTGKYNELQPKIENYITLPAVKELLKSPGEYIDSLTYESWEQFFTAVLHSVSSIIRETYHKNVKEDYFSNSMLLGVKTNLEKQDVYAREVVNTNNSLKMQLFK